MNAERRPRIGVLALQGAVRPHVEAIREVGGEPVEVRLPRDLVHLDALILPGGESTTMRRLVDAYGLREPISAMARSGTPMLGTCAGMILLAERLADGDEPYFGLLDLEVRRNGYGRQLDSFETDLTIPALGDEPLHAIFIRAPIVTGVGPLVEVLARDADGNPVAGRQGRVVATAFHPELPPDRRIHRLLVELVGDASRRPA
ncbi:MAG TPA: pyridoxal 5'-phosphate synthase glutaminase subunit PdxT [Candidatus Binatia bacterium]|nr:pyridoxal 5'-phosphate synthase glutaminase subunit PdxT [Candidatus Binatia bacterium]